MFNNYKKFLYITGYILIAFYTFSKNFLLDYDIQTNIKIPESADKLFYLEIPKWPSSNIISQDSRVKIIKDYLGNTFSDNKIEEDIYIFKCIFQDNKFYVNYTIEDKINCVMITSAFIEIYNNKNNLLLKLFIYARAEKIIEYKNELDSTKEELLQESFISFLNKINQNENFINFINNTGYSKNDDSLKLKNKIQPWKELLTKNKNDYRLLFSLGCQFDIGAYFSVVSPIVSFQSSIGKIGFEIYPLNLFSIEYQFDISHLLFSLLYSGFYGYKSIQIDNDLYFNFNFFNTPFFCNIISFIVGHKYNYFTSEDSSTQYTYKAGNFYIEDKFVQNIHSFRIGIGYKFLPTNPYISRNTGSYGIEICYIPTYNDYFNELFHGIQILFTIKSNWNLFFFREKPLKSVSKNYFQVR